MSTINPSLRGIVQDGKVVFQSGQFPEGTAVVVTPVATDAGTTPDTPSIGKKLAALGRAIESMPSDLPPDLAANHDHYVHGPPKRRTERGKNANRTLIER